MKFTVLLRGSHTIVPLQNSVLTSNYNSVFVKRVAVFWEYFNIRERITLMTVKTDDGPVEVAVYPGYYTFNDMKEKLGKSGVTLRLQETLRAGFGRFTITRRIFIQFLSNFLQI
jgi:hypothetical protein